MDQTRCVHPFWLEPFEMRNHSSLMKRVLIIAYYFPPMGMGGVQRTTKFARYLPDFGWEPTVLTVKPVAYYAHDPSLLDEVKHVRIVRAESLDPLRLVQRLRKGEGAKTVPNASGGGLLSRIHGWMTRWFLIPDSKVLWRPFAKQAVRRLQNERPFDLVLTSSPPHSVHALGAWMQSKYGTPWVADFRDIWMGESYERGPTPFHNVLNARMARCVVRRADAVISVSTPGSRILEAVRGSSVHTLHNGFDADDFKIKVEKDTPSERMTFTYTGSMNALFDPEDFLKAIRLLLEKHADMQSRIRIRFVGASSSTDLESSIRSFGLEDAVEWTGYVPHHESVRSLIQTDALLLPLEASLSEAHTPGKVFEYLASGRPILGVMPESEAARLIREYDAGQVVHPGDVQGIADALLNLYRAWENGALKSHPVCRPSLQQFERKHQTGTLARMFDAILSGLRGTAE